MAGDKGGISPIPPPPKVRVLSCPQCGASLSLRGMQQTQSLACGSCGAVIDITDESMTILETHRWKVRYEPLIPLGSRGKLRGDTFEVIGYLRRAINVEGIDYAWSEYLLFNPFEGFRWLTEYNGHWNYVRSTTNIPKKSVSGTHPAVSYLGQTYQHYQTAEARVTYVIGEFYWKVSVGEKCRVSDYISPPYILSCEESDKEVSWSTGDYIEPAAVWQGFQLTTQPPPRIGIAPNQPSPYGEEGGRVGRMSAGFLIAAVLIQVSFIVISQNKMVYKNNFTFSAGDKDRVQVTDTFELSGRPSNVVIHSRADVDNHWIYLSMALIEENSGRAYDFGREISYYQGIDGGEKWSEGRKSDTATLPAVPAGRYYLRIEPDSDVPRMEYSIEVVRDVPGWSFFFLALGGISIVPLFSWTRRRGFESKRWADSDYAPESDSSDDD